MEERPIVALATALAPAALAVIRMSGEGSIDLAAMAFSRPDALRGAPGHTVVHGSIEDAAGAALDDVLALVFRGPRSYTGEDAVELTCHGSPAGVRRIMARLFEVGFVPAQPGEFTRRSFSNGKLDLTSAEAVNEIVLSQTAAAHSMAIDRLNGAVQRAVASIREAIVRVLAQLSIQLDYPEEETGLIETDEKLLSDAASEARSLASTYERGRLYQDGATVVLTGATNAGKSSLFNALLRQDRAIVSATPGTTRDYVEAMFNAEGIPVRLFDTAGLRSTNEEIEGEGIRRTQEIARVADLILEVFDASSDLRVDTASSGSRVHARLTVANKIDLPGADSDSGDIAVSAVTGTGVDLLTSAIATTLLERTSSEHGGLAIDSVRQRDLLMRCADAIDHALTSLRSRMPADAVSVDLQDAADAIGEITGEVTSAEILDQMFGAFCVGK